MIPLRMLDELDAVTIPVACPVPWETMPGGPRTRFCDKCSQNVHDVSELSRAEAIQLVTGSDKLPCLRIYKRQDGRVMTADCMSRRERAWKWLYRYSAVFAAVFAVIFFMGYEHSRPTAGVPCREPQTPTELAVEESAQSIVEGIVSEAATQNKSATGR